MIEETPYTEKLLGNSEFNIRTILDVLLARWYWFILSVLVCLGLAYVYLQTVQTMYKREAIVLLKEEAKTEDAFVEKQLFNRGSNVNNEILIFKSRTLMEEVVRRLSLNIRYSVEQGLKRNALYTNSPVWVELADSLKDKSLSFSITPVGEDICRLTGLSADPEEETMVQFGKAVATPVGSVIVNKTAVFSARWLHVPILVDCVSRQGAITSCLGNLEVERAEKEASLLALKYQDLNPDRADAILNTLISVYNDEAMRDKNQVIQHTALFIDDRLALINAELGEVDSDIESFKKKNRLTNITSEAGLYLSNNSRYEQEEIELANQIELVRMIQDYMRDPIKGGQLLPTNSGIMDTGVEGMIDEYNRNLLIYNKLKRGSSDHSPVVGDIGVNLQALRNTIIQVLGNLQKALNLKLADARRQQEITGFRISKVPTQEKYMLTIERQQKIKEELYLYLLNKREENALSMATAESNLRVIDPAYGSGTTGANRIVIWLGALLAGLAIPGLIFYLQPMLDVTVRGRRDIEENLTIPFLGEIPFHGKGKEGITKNGRDGVSEAFRIIRSNLDFVLNVKTQSKVIMFTSANPGAGKSFVSMNLAASLAWVGKRVILLEMDIRKGSEKDEEGKVLPGITHYLSGKISDVSGLIRPCRYNEELDVISSGPIPPNPAELLLSPRLEELVFSLKETYEYILIDTVPYGMVVDAREISRVSDLNIYVIREGRMDRRQLPDVEHLHTERKLANMAVLLNGVHNKHAGYGYGYGYYGYGYGKSYYGYETKKKK
ncbi:polysaccharide biosynthesis tyrosine autokinase [Parabacteroides sp. GYB001]|uniref:GumC family protein n=1 Tax=Parabacteroides leei TaxID=2939491 RepID=UPI002017F75B|nr:polysaccharide biosynthesis tyrosine autokinase [Parabacteroides leei]MCL3852061.1 polysaccharide biosynthesis tyrosine autokinase [Parabacteroides leei]